MSDYIGIDFGTSNCVIAAYIDGKEVIVPIESDGSLKMRTTMFVKEAIVTSEDINDDELISEIETIKQTLRNELIKEKENFQGLSTQVRAMEKTIDLRKSFEELPESYQLIWNSKERSAKKLERIKGDLADDKSILLKARSLAFSSKKNVEKSLSEKIANGELLFGKQAFDAFLSDPESGTLFNSPKNFLGAKLNKQQLQTFEVVIAQFLSYLKAKVDQYLSRDIKKVVLSKPVNYHSVGDPAVGNLQATRLMKHAAMRAGFENIEFIDEPIAAGLSFENSLDEESSTLIVDIGGGTTDLTYATLSPSKVGNVERSSDIKAVGGGRFGGIELDKKIGFHVVAPYFGKPTSSNKEIPVPYNIFSKIFAIDNLPELTEFYSERNRETLSSWLNKVNNAELFRRVLTIQNYRLSHRIMHSIDIEKQRLSSATTSTLNLNYIEDTLSIPLKRSQLVRSFRDWYQPLDRLLDKIMIGQESPDVIFLTGGMSLSPLVQEALVRRFPEIPQITSDAFSSVAKGALLAAKSYYSQDITPFQVEQKEVQSSNNEPQPNEHAINSETPKDEIIANLRTTIQKIENENQELKAKLKLAHRELDNIYAIAKKTKSNLL
ncbi:TPA: Hsp70 family protein [Vibrio parahaemolyticus]|nr:Hsp70 family protein [Vibrio parahaemolyticus]